MHYTVQDLDEMGLDLIFEDLDYQKVEGEVEKWAEQYKKTRTPIGGKPSVSSVKNFKRVR